VRALDILVLVSLASGLVGCSREIRDAGEVEASSAGPGQGGGAGDDGAGGDGDGHGDAGAGAARPARYGDVIFGNITYVGGEQGEIGGVSALFEAEVEDQGCVSVDVAACRYVTCADAVWSDAPFADAGAMSVTGTSTAPPDPVRDPVHGAYDGWIEGPLFAPGDVIGVTLSGATVPAFAASVVAPARYIDVLPPPETLFAISRAAPIELSWNLEDGEEGAMRVQIAPIFELVGDGLGYQALDCTAPLADRALTIPAEGLALLEDRDPLSIRFRGISRTETVSGDWDVWVDAQQILVVQDITLTD
jgi:hypothetical protein